MIATHLPTSLDKSFLSLSLSCTAAGPLRHTLVPALVALHADTVVGGHGDRCDRWPRKRSQCGAQSKRLGLGGTSKRHMCLGPRSTRQNDGQQIKRKGLGLAQRKVTTASRRSAKLFVRTCALLFCPGNSKHGNTLSQGLHLFLLAVHSLLIGKRLANQINHVDALAAAAWPNKFLKPNVRRSFKSKQIPLVEPQVIGQCSVVPRMSLRS